jgi:hypothetical protein
MNYETHLLNRLEKLADRQIKESSDPQDHVSFDIPLFIRLLELAREDIKSDVDLHNVVERTLAIKNQGVLTMDDYETIAGTQQAPVEEPKKDHDLDEIRRLSGIR